MRQCLCAAILLGFGAAYALLTPPFEVPDEVGHYWRASSIAYGHVAPRGDVPMPRGLRAIVYWLWMSRRGEPVDRTRVASARAAPLEPEIAMKVRPYALYSPAAYAPQVVAATIARLVRLRPYFGFYLGRFAALLAAAMAVVMAIRIAPEWRDVFETVAFLPMTLFLFASWSADAMTIAAAFLVSAFVLNGRALRWPAVVSSGWLSLCKPAYALLALLFVFAAVRRRMKWIVIGVVIAGALVATTLTMSVMSAPRTDRPIDAHAQLRFIAAHPAALVRVLAGDLRKNGRDYLESMTGRLGPYELKLPLAITLLLFASLIAAGVTSGPPLPPRVRIAIVAIVVAIVVATLSYLYITSSIAGGDVIEGAQGRYLLPCLPLLLTTLRIRRIGARVPAAVIYAVAIVANVVALRALLVRYW